MKNKYFLLTLVLASTAIMATSCQKEEGTVTLGAEIQRPTNGKVYINDHTPCWHNGDEVYINNAAYAVIAATGSSAQIEQVTRHDTYRAIFPAGIVASGSNISNSASVPVTLPAVQQYQMVGDHQRVDVPMGAYLTSGSTLHFYNLCSIVRVMVSNTRNTNIAVRSITLTASQARLSGNGTATVSGQSSDCITMSSSANHSVSLTMPEGEPVSIGALESKSFDIVVPGFTTDDVTITVFTTEGIAQTVKNNVGLTNNTITTATCSLSQFTDYPPAAFLIDGPTFNARIPSTATSVAFEYNTLNSSNTLLSTLDSPTPIYGYLEGTTWKVCTLADTIYAHTNCSTMFASRSLTHIDFGERFNTSRVTNMRSMFSGCGATCLNLSSFNTENVTNMSGMFYGCYAMSLDLSSFNNENVTNMSYMFSYCRATSLNLSSFNTENVTNMSSMFSVCHATSLNLSSFNTENVTNMSSMFSECYNLTSLNLSNFNTENVTTMSWMFSGCSSLTSLNLSSFNTENVTSMSGMFSGCSSLTSLNLSSFNTSLVRSMSGMFSGCSSLTSLDVSNFNTSNVTDMGGYYQPDLDTFSGGMFCHCSSLINLDLSNFNTSRVINMQYMFYDCSSLTGLDLSNFDMSHVEYVEGGQGGLYNGKGEMCYNLSITSGACTITCPQAVEDAINDYYVTRLPTSGVTFTWVRPTSK